MKIIDVHNHVGHSADGGAVSPEEIKSVMHEAGVTQFVICPTDEPDRSPCYTDQNNRIADAVRANPHIIGFGRVAPTQCPNAVDEVHRMAAIGLRGLKLHIISDKFEIQEARAVVDAAAALDMPVLCHSHHTCFTDNAKHWTTLFAETGATFIVAHGGKDSYKDLARIATKYQNVFIDTSCVTIWRTRILFDSLGPARFLFASDMPYGHPRLEKLKWSLVTSGDDLESVFSRNACRVFGIDENSL